METTCSHSIVLIFIIICIFLSACSSTTRTISDDQSALFAFRAHITSDPQNILATNWSANSSPCKWIGVYCGLRHQRVTSLNISNMGLTGTISPYLGNLSFLSSLDLSSNSFHGILPKELARLRRLKEVYLRYNYFTGEIPSWLGKLEQLQHLVLNNNSFTGSIPDAIFNISSSRQIRLGANNLSGSLPVDICNHLPKLEFLSLSYNNIIGQIPSNLYRCTELQILSLASNGFSGSIPPEIGNLTMLKELYLGGNNWKDAMIPLEIGNLKRLEILSIINGRLTGPVPSSIFNMSSLKGIYLSDNSFSGNLPVDIPFNLSVLEMLYLSANQLTGQIPSSLWECKALQILLLNDNIFTGSISKQIGNLTLLQHLYLNDNNLKEYGREGIVSTKGDVYSYGVMLMEAFTRKKPTDELFSSEMSLRSWVTEALHGSVLQVVDVHLVGSWDENLSTKELCVSSILGLALDCSKDSPAERITMKDVVVRLQKIKNMLPESKDTKINIVASSIVSAKAEELEGSARKGKGKGVMKPEDV